MRTILHLDLDCFFAAVELAERPELRGKAVCVGGHRGQRGIVSCPNYEARAYGVRTAMPLRTASRLLPSDAIFIPGNHRLYGAYSRRVMGILEEFTPDVEQVSVDEAYLDMTGCMHLWGGDAVRVARAMKQRIMQECGLTVSIGVATSRLCAKIAAGLRKPDGLVVIPAGAERDVLAPLPVEILPGVGRKTLPVLQAMGIRTVADLLESRLTLPVAAALRHRVGQAIEGKEDWVVHAGRMEQSVSRDTTFGEDTNDRGLILATMFYLVERCCRTLRAKHYHAMTVTVKVRYSDFITVQRQTMLHAATSNEEEFFAAAGSMLEPLLPAGRAVRLVGIKASHLVEAGQMCLDVAGMTRREELHRRLDALREKHGYHAVRWGITEPLRTSLRHDGAGSGELHSAREH